MNKLHLVVLFKKKRNKFALFSLFYFPTVILFMFCTEHIVHQKCTFICLYYR